MKKKSVIVAHLSLHNRNSLIFFSCNNSERYSNTTYKVSSGLTQMGGGFVLYSGMTYLPGPELFPTSIPPSPFIQHSTLPMHDNNESETKLLPLAGSY